MNRNTDISSGGYIYESAECGCAHAYLLPRLSECIKHLPCDDKRLFDLGCGNGSVGNWFAKQGWSVTGVDPSVDGVRAANERYPDLKITIGSAYDSLAETYGRFPVLVSLEVVEHVFFPREYAKSAFDLLEPGGTAIISTPYHG